MAKKVIRTALFPWECRSLGGLFFLQDFEAPYECPYCHKQDAFESGDCRRIWANEFFPERTKKAYSQ